MNIPPEELIITHARSSGPGGSNVNKTNTKCILKWNIESSSVWGTSEDSKKRFKIKFKNKINKDGCVILNCQESRNQINNKLKCVEKLHDMLEEAFIKPKKRTGHKVKIDKEDRLKTKYLKSKKKQSRFKGENYESS